MSAKPSKISPQNPVRTAGELSSSISLKSLEGRENGRISQSDVLFANPPGHTSRRAFEEGSSGTARLAAGCFVFHLFVFYGLLVTLAALVLTGRICLLSCTENTGNTLQDHHSYKTLEEKIDGLRLELNNTKRELQQAQNDLATMKTLQLNTSSTPSGPGPRGPPGFNGTGGPPGPKGSGDMRLCEYRAKKGNGVKQGSSATDDIVLDEPKVCPLCAQQGWRVLGATCSTDGAQQVILTSTNLLVRSYKCECKGTSSHFIPSGKMHCYIHYWQCPLEP